jgi:hypothetical protein
MRSSTKLLFVIGCIFACAAVVLYPRPIQGGPRKYEIQPQVTIPGYRTDAARAIDAYEQLMERYMDLTERNLFEIGADVRDVIKRLDSIDGQLRKLSAKIAGIERALGIEQDQSKAEKKSEQKAFDIEVHGESSPPGH